MMKKLGLFIFMVGFGSTFAYALPGDSCETLCARTYYECLPSHTPTVKCKQDYFNCVGDCQ